MAVWDTGVWASLVWADNVWEGLTSGGGSAPTLSIRRRRRRSWARGRMFSRVR